MITKISCQQQSTIDKAIRAKNIHTLALILRFGNDKLSVDEYCKINKIIKESGKKVNIMTGQVIK